MHFLASDVKLLKGHIFLMSLWSYSDSFGSFCSSPFYNVVWACLHLRFKMRPEEWEMEKVQQEQGPQ